MDVAGGVPAHAGSLVHTRPFLFPFINAGMFAMCPSPATQRPHSKSPSWHPRLHFMPVGSAHIPAGHNGSPLPPAASAPCQTTRPREADQASSHAAGQVSRTSFYLNHKVHPSFLVFQIKEINDIIHTGFSTHLLCCCRYDSNA